MARAHEEGLAGPATFHLPADIVKALDLASAEGDCSRSRQAARYLRRCLVEDGWLPPRRSLRPEPDTREAA